MIEFNRSELANGLILLHHEDTTTPFVVVNTLYKVGAKDEDEHRTGFAHLFEHLMFGGTKNFPDFDKPLQESGGENNAFTNNDYTNYYDIVPAENIEIPLCLEADRMTHLNINKKSLEVQRKVVCEEFKEHYINQPYGDVWHLIREMVYEKHNYKWPTIGKELKHIEEATLDDVRSFYQKYYQPGNAILVIAGNINWDKTQELVQNYFGAISSTAVEHNLILEPEQTAAKTKTVHEEVPFSALFINFKMEDRLNKAYYTADICSDLLSNGAASRLQKNLVKEKKVFIEIDCYISGSVETGIFTVEGKVKEDVDMAYAEQLVWEELEKLKTGDVHENELTKCKNKMLTYMNFSDSSLLNRSISLAFYELLGDAQLINKEEEFYTNITSADVQVYAQSLFVKEKSNTLYYLKK